MKNTVIGILLITTLVFGGLYFHQTGKTNEVENTADGLKQKVDELQASVDTQQKQASTLRGQLENIHDVTASHAGEVAQLKQSLTQLQQAPAARTAESSTNAKTANPMAEMFKNPEMREMIKTQQKAVIGPMLEKQYADFITGAHLTTEQAAAMKELLTTKTLSAADAGMSMLGGDTDATKRSEMMAQIKSDGEAADAQIKQLLGDDTYTQFQAYEKTMPERSTISSFNDQLAGSGTGLSADQQQQLMQLMSQDRQNFKFTIDYNDKSKFDGDYSTFFSEDKINQYEKEAAQLNETYVAHAGAVLSTDQLAAFQKFLTAQEGMGIAGMKMAAKMFGSGK